MKKQIKVLSIFHIIIAVFFFISAIYMLLSKTIPYALLLSISSIYAVFVSISVNFNFVFPIILFLFSGFAIIIGIGLFKDWHFSNRAVIIVSIIYLLCFPFGTILGIYTLCTLSSFSERIFSSMIIQFAIVLAIFFLFHKICPDINKYCKQNPKTPMGIAGQLRDSTAPLYSSQELRFKIKTSPLETHATMGLNQAKQGNTDNAIKEFEKSIEILKQKNDEEEIASLSKERFNTWIILPLIAMVIYFIVSSSLIKSEQKIPLPILLIAVIGLKIGIDLSVSLINGGFFTLGIPISNSLEYYADVPKVEGIWSFLRDFNKLALSHHSKTHPPGGALFSWAVAKLFNYDLITTSLAIIVFSTLTLIPIYLLAKQLYGEKIGRYSLALCLVTPNIVLFSATSFDAVFTVFLVWSIYLYFRALHTHPILYGILTGVLLTISMLMNFTTTTLGVYFIVLALVAYLSNLVLPTNNVSQQFKRHLKVLFTAGSVVVLLYLLLYLGPHYNVFTNLQIALKKDSGGGTGYETIARYFFLSITNLFAFFIYIGVPTTVLWFRESSKTIRKAFQRSRFDNLLIAFILTFIGIAFSTLFTLEVERIWMYMLPFILIPAGNYLSSYIEERQEVWMFYVITALLWIQLLFFEIFLNTRW